MKRYYVSVLFLMAYAVTAAPSPFYTYATTTGSNMPIAVPLSADPTLDGAPLGDSDEIGAFSKAGLCVGAAIWDSIHNQGITVVGQNSLSLTTDGLNNGDSIYFRVWHYSTRKEALAVVTFSSEGAVFNSFGAPIIAGITAVSSAISDPVLASPANGATGLPVSLPLRWGLLGGATSYGVQVSADAGFGSTVSNQTGITSQSASINGLAINTTYYWRANASSGSVTSFWAGIWSFTTTTTAVLSNDVRSATGPSLAFLNGRLLYSLPAAANTEIELYDMTGRTALVISRVEPAGNHFVNLRECNLVSGRYVARIRYGDTEKWIPILLAR
jgi:hypothetical protein